MSFPFSLGSHFFVAKWKRLNGKDTNFIRISSKNLLGLELEKNTFTYITVTYFSITTADIG